MLRFLRGQFVASPLSRPLAAILHLLLLVSVFIHPALTRDDEGSDGKIKNAISTFSADRFEEFFYLAAPDSANVKDETVVLRTDLSDVFISFDHGKSWEVPEELQGKRFAAIYPHEYFPDIVYFVTQSKTVYYTHDRGKTFHKFKAPAVPNKRRLQVLTFHPTQKDWLIWTAAKECDSSFSTKCHSVAYYSVNGGDEWHVLQSYVRKCRFVQDKSEKKSDKLVICAVFEKESVMDEDNRLQLIASDNWFEDKTIHFPEIIDFATMQEFIIVAAKDEDKKSLKLDASVDGKTFADARFPYDFHVKHQQAYTVLDSSTHSVFLHVTVNGDAGSEQGAIMKSNSNGTSYVTSLRGVNRNREGYVDFEKMQGLEGVALVNVVSNLETAGSGEPKKLRTMITHNDGGEWAYLTPPEADADSGLYPCDGDGDECKLHLHGYTERSDPRRTYSSPSAVGLMLGIGNVGSSLGRKADADTFITQDGGISWISVIKGPYMWEYGDQGSIIVIVKQEIPTNEVLYTLDEGKTWQTYKFSEHKMRIEDISTVPSDTSRNFMLWGRDLQEDKIATVNLDFTGLTDVQCQLAEGDPDDSDYYTWTPKHPLSDSNCLFGHVSEYHRKKPDSICFNGRNLENASPQKRICECTRQDFECDYNFERKPDGQCVLVEGFQPPDPAEMCRQNSKIIEYYAPTGYRRIPLTTCEGGKELDMTGGSRACPGHEEEHRLRQSPSGWGTFFAIIVPVTLAMAVGYFVWQNWDGKFGRIRLGDGSGSPLSGTRSTLFSADGPVVRGGVAVAAGVVAVLGVVPLVVGAVGRAALGMWDRLRGGGRRYTSRQSFSRGQYSIVDEDEGELLGNESDEEA